MLTGSYMNFRTMFPKRNSESLSDSGLVSVSQATAMVANTIHLCGIRGISAMHVKEGV